MKAGPSRRYSVVIPSKGRPEMLRRALRSVAAQTLPPEKICLVVDEKEDRSRYAFLREFDDRLEVHFSGGGKGGAGARNIGLQKATGDYVFFLDDDDEWLPEKCERQIVFLESRRDCVGVTCWRRATTGDVERVRKVDEGLVNRNLRVLNFAGSFSFFGYRLDERTRDVRLDEHLRAAQDFEFYLQLSRFGSIGVVPEVLAHYHAHDDERISGKPKTKVESYAHVLQKHGSSLSISERLASRAKIYAFRCGYSSRAGSAVLAVGAVLLVVLALREPAVVRFIARRSFAYVRLRLLERGGRAPFARGEASRR